MWRLERGSFSAEKHRSSLLPSGIVGLVTMLLVLAVRLRTHGWLLAAARSPLDALLQQPGPATDVAGSVAVPSHQHQRLLQQHERMDAAAPSSTPLLSAAPAPAPSAFKHPPAALLAMPARSASSQASRQCWQHCRHAAELGLLPQQCLARCLAHPQAARYMDTLRQLVERHKRKPRCSPDVHFVAFFATGERGSEGHHRDQLPSLDASFAAALRLSHPGSKVTVITDQSTQLSLPQGVELFRFPILKSRLGRNAWANYFQYQAQTAFLTHIEQQGSTADVVFLDTDILVVDDVAHAFCQDFDYGFTLSDDSSMPINIGMQFVRHGHYMRAATFLQSMLVDYPMQESFVAGQVAIANHLGLMNNRTEVLRLLDGAVQLGAAFKHAPDATGSSSSPYAIALLPCHLYNSCTLTQSCCTDPTAPHRLPLSLLVADAPQASALHFVGHRKVGLPRVLAGLEERGVQGAQAEWLRLPHDQTHYEQYARAA